MPDVFVTLPESPYPLALVQDGPKKYAGEWICGKIVQCDGNVVAIEAISDSALYLRTPVGYGMLGLAGYGPILKCGQHKASRWQTIWSGLPGAVAENLTEIILTEAGNAVLTLMAESAPTLTQYWEIFPLDQPMLLLGGEGTLAAKDWFPQEEDTVGWIPQDEDTPGWVPQDEDAVGAFVGVTPDAV